MQRIVEIVGRSSQGITRPFLCRSEQGVLYYAKGKRAGTRALISEWIAGHLGRAMDLPLPEFDQLDIPSALVEFSARSDVHELGRGVVFGSRCVENVCDLSFLAIDQIDIQLRATVLLHDWWIQNSDRTLTDSGGNPNL